MLDSSVINPSKNAHKTQRWKNPGSMVTMLPGKFPTIWKIQIKRLFEGLEEYKISKVIAKYYGRYIMKSMQTMIGNKGTPEVFQINAKFPADFLTFHII